MEEPQEPQPLPQKLSDRLKLLGFDPETPVFEVIIDFDEDLVRDSLFATDHLNLYVLTFVVHSDLGGIKDNWNCPMVADLAQPVFVPFRIGNDELPLGYYDRPDWYLRGYFYRSPLDPEPELIRMHAYLQRAGDTKDFGMGYIQVVRPVRPPSGGDKPLFLGTGAPGQP